jgi:hypothetical protein
VAPEDLVVPEGFKWCPDCGRVLPLTDFVRTVRTSSGYHSYCKPCHNKRSRASREKAGGSRTYHLSRRYGITADEAEVMLTAQGGLCAICREASAEHVDHDHGTGAVRALLCFNCNCGLGQFRDDPVVLRAAADYVEHHRDNPSGRAARAPTGSPRAGACSPGMARWRAMMQAEAEAHGP